MRLPTDLENILAVTIRDVIWFKDRVVSFLSSCQVPEAILVDVRRKVREKTPTIKIVHHVLEQLDTRGDDGYLVAKRILTEMHRWNGRAVHRAVPRSSWPCRQWNIHPRGSRDRPVGDS